MLDRLDMTSFANSIGPRRMPGKRTLAAYGFTDVRSLDDGRVQASKADGSWAIGVAMLKHGARHRQLCITDTALNGGSYHTVTAVDVERGSDGWWRATGQPVMVAACTDT